MGRGHGCRAEALDRAPVLAERRGGGGGVRSRAVRQGRPPGRRRDGGAPVFVRERSEGAAARVLLRDAAGRTADATALQARARGHRLPRAEARGFPHALRGPERGEPVADLDRNRNRTLPVHPEDRHPVAALPAGRSGARGASPRGAHAPRQHRAADARARRPDARRVLRQPGVEVGDLAGTHPCGHRGGAAGEGSGRGAFGEYFSGYDLRQSGNGDRYQRGPRQARNEEAPAARPRPDHGGELLVNATSRLWCRALLIAMCAPLASCSAIRFAYTNADTALRFMASSYLDLDPAQDEEMRIRIAQFHEWHRANELPAYAGLMRSASRRAARGITAEDVAWGLSSVRSRYRKFAIKAAEDAAPVLATLAPDQIAALERKFADNNQKFEKQFLPADDEKRRRAQATRMLERFRDFAGDLTAEQEASIERFALAHERHVALRFEDRRQWQRDVIAALRAQRQAQELGRSLADIFSRPERRRSEDFIREDKIWDEHL